MRHQVRSKGIELANSVANELNRAMPTFQVYKSGEQAGQLVGADPTRLEVCVFEGEQFERSES